MSKGWKISSDNLQVFAWIYFNYERIIRKITGITSLKVLEFAFFVFFIKFSTLLLNRNEMLDIVSKRHINFIISACLLVVSLLMFTFWKLNFWIDITGGTQTEYTYSDTIDLETFKTNTADIAKEINLNTDIINTTSVYKVTWEKTFVVEAWFNRWLPETEIENYKNDFRSKIDAYLFSYDESIVFSKYVNIGASFWDYIKDTAKITLLLAIIGISLYVAYAFSQAVWGISSSSFAIVTIITLFHDVVIASGLYILVSSFLPEFKIDTFFVTALLTILWYSIYDTIVVSDRIRANLKLFWGKKKELKEIVNMSVNETLSRSIYTSLTLLFVLFAILFFWPESIGWFTLVMIFGTLVWTYSSIFIASPLIYEINKNKKLAVYKKKEKSQEDLIVV